jgi:hypothetical protein
LDLLLGVNLGGVPYDFTHPSKPGTSWKIEVNVSELEF